MLPRLIHQLPVRLQRLKRELTVMDPVAREPIRQVWREGFGPGVGAELALEAQVEWNRDGRVAKPRFLPGGVEEEYLGYLLFAVADLVSAGYATEVDGVVTISIARGDRISRIGRRAVDLYVLWFRDVAGYTDQGGATLLEVTFGDRPGA